jgi:hypothetical protein
MSDAPDTSTENADVFTDPEVSNDRDDEPTDFDSPFDSETDSLEDDEESDLDGAE